jgi:transglutaminase-like putative cysteine protease
LLSIDRSYQIFLDQKDHLIIPEISDVISSFYNITPDPLDMILQLNTYVFNNFKYIPAVTNIYTPLNEVWRIKVGVCQDFSHVLIKMLRVVNIPARYVSGYICPNNNGFRGDGASHAWLEAYFPITDG